MKTVCTRVYTTEVTQSKILLQKYKNILFIFIPGTCTVELFCTLYLCTGYLAKFTRNKSVPVPPVCVYITGCLVDHVMM